MNYYRIDMKILNTMYNLGKGFYDYTFRKEKLAPLYA